MRWLYLLAVSLVILTFLKPAEAQNIDSLTRVVDSSRKAFEETQQRFRQWQDSVNRARLQKFIDKNNQPLDDFLKQMRERERKERWALVIRIAAGVAFLALLLWRLTRRKKGGEKPIS